MTTYYWKQEPSAGPRDDPPIFRFVRRELVWSYLVVPSFEDRPTGLCLHPYNTPIHLTIGGMHLLTNPEQPGQKEISADIRRLARENIPLEALVTARQREIPLPIRVAANDYLNQYYLALSRSQRQTA